MELILAVEVPPTFSIRQACVAAVNLARRTGATIRFEWNGVLVHARAAEEPETLAARATRVLEHGGKLVV